MKSSGVTVFDALIPLHPVANRASVQYVAIQNNLPFDLTYLAV